MKKILFILLVSYSTISIAKDEKRLPSQVGGNIGFAETVNHVTPVGDHMWWMCSGATESLNILANVYESRNGPDKRRTLISVIAGANIYTGSYDNTDSPTAKSIPFKGINGNPDNFKADVLADYSSNKFSLKVKSANKGAGYVFKGANITFDCKEY